MRLNVNILEIRFILFFIILVKVVFSLVGDIKLSVNKLLVIFLRVYFNKCFGYVMFL